MKVWIVLIIAAVGIATAVNAQSLRWALVNWKVRHDFPKVPRIEIAQLQNWLHDARRTQPLLLDVRTTAEFDVSHLQGARQVDPGASADAISLPHDRPIVTYCSVGYRSGGFAEKLREAGYTHVQNLTGSIFAWANAGYPIERDGKRVDKVHPYNATWGKLLKPELRADVPAAGEGM